MARACLSRPPAFWKAVIDGLRSFIDRANQELGEQIFSGLISGETTVVYTVVYEVGPESQSGEVSYSRRERQIALTVRGGGAEVFALAIDESGTLVARDSTGSAINAEDLVQLFVRRLTKVESVTYSESAIDSRLLMDRQPREI